MSDPAQAHRVGPLTTEDAIPLLQQKVTEKGTDSFKVKVYRQTNAAASPIHVASLAGANVEHLANPETWLVMLAGGGPLYILTATHASESLPTVNYRPSNLVGVPRDVDPKITSHPEWKGPPEITFPTVNDKTNSAPISDLTAILGTRPPGLQGPTARGDSAAGGAGPSSEILELRLQHGFEAMARAIDAQAKASERQIAMLVEAMKSQAVAKPVKSVTEQLVDLAPVITSISGLILPLITKSKEVEAEARKQLADLEAKREERERQDRSEMMKTLQSQNEKAASASADTMKVIAPMVDAVSQMGRTVLQQVATLRELTASDHEEGWGSAVRNIAAAFGEYVAAKEGGMSPTPPQLPPGRPAAPPPPQPTQQPAIDPAEVEYLKTTPPEAILHEIENAIRGHTNPEDVAEGFLNAVVVNAEVVKVVNAAGGVVPFFRSKLGDGWIETNAQYVNTVIATLSNAARTRGIKL